MLATLMHSAEIRASYMRRLGREDAATAASFVATLDNETRQMRFHGFTTPEMVRMHYAALDWDAVILTAWVADGAVRGLSEAMLYHTPYGMESEVALCVDRAWTGRGIGWALVAEATAEAARRGSWRSVMVVASGDCEHADAARLLGARLDEQQGLTELVHAPITKPQAVRRRA